MWRHVKERRDHHEEVLPGEPGGQVGVPEGWGRGYQEEQMVPGNQKSYIKIGKKVKNLRIFKKSNFQNFRSDEIREQANNTN